MNYVDGYHVQLIAQDLGQDDQLRAELEEELMSDTATTNHNLSLPFQGKPPSRALQLAKGGSPISTHTRSPM